MRQPKWSAKLAEFQYSIYYQPGSKMGKPGALTCRDNEEIKAGVEHCLFNVGQLNEIHLANYADEYVDDEPIVVVHQVKP